MIRHIDIVIFLTGCTLVLYCWGQVTAQQREVEMFVNVYDHPKTGFSCKDKAPGQYYADPETKCAVYYICISNPTGTLSPQSFACPNGTIFSQATRVCRPHEEVYCQLASRYYGNTHGTIDEKEAFDILPLPVAVPSHFPSHQSHKSDTLRQSPPRAQKPQRDHVHLHTQPLAAAPPAPPPAQPVPQPKPAPAANSNLFNSNGSNRFRNSRIFAGAQPSTSTSTTTTQAPSAAGPALSDYEYDYGEYNETGQANAASSLHAQIIENVAEAIAKDMAKSEADKKIVPEIKARRKRESELSRRKGQLMEVISDLSSLDEALTPIPSSAAFTCEDKVAGLPYADISSGCAKFHLCVNVSKGKLWSYHLACDEGKRFNQALGMCDSALTDKECTRSERYYAYNKWHKASKKHFLDSAKKLHSTSQQ